jgi:hypothetical protein
MMKGNGTEAAFRPGRDEAVSESDQTEVLNILGAGQALAHEGEGRPSRNSVSIEFECCRDSGNEFIRETFHVP